jgi:TonB family protein
MKWVLVVALSLLLVLACVVYLQHERRLPVPPPAAVPMATPVKPHRAVQRRPLKVGPQSPVDISGPLKDRSLVQWVLPDYPEWAQQQGITGVLRTKIWVTPAGQVQSFMEPQQLSGEPRLDEKAVEALRQWQFVEKPNSFGDQWGIVTIRFSLLVKEEEQPGASVRGISLGNRTISGAWECVRQWAGGVFVYICKLRPPRIAD